VFEHKGIMLQIIEPIAHVWVTKVNEAKAPIVPKHFGV
jgi:hypothetical protein